MIKIKAWGSNTLYPPSHFYGNYKRSDKMETLGKPEYLDKLLGVQPCTGLTISIHACLPVKFLAHL